MSNVHNSSLLSFNNYSKNIFSKTNMLCFSFLAIFMVATFAIQVQLSPVTLQSPSSNTPKTGTPDKSNGNSNTQTSTVSSTRLALLQSVDSNNNLIADGLDAKITQDSPNTLEKVIVSLKENIPVPNSLTDSFKSHGGVITFQWNDLGMFSGPMPAKYLHSFALANYASSNPLGLIEQDQPIVKMSEPEKLTNVQPYVWDNYNLLGDPNSSIAIFDTGIDTSHPMLANFGNQSFTNNSVKVVGWYDATPDKSPLPEDMDGHGTHVAAIAAGFPYNDTNSNGNLNVTSVNNYNVSSSNDFVTQGGFPMYLNITTPGTITETYYWRRTGGTSITEGTGLYLYSPTSYSSYVASDTTNTPITSNSGTFTISYTVTSNFGLYLLLPVFNYQDVNSNLEMVTYGNYPYSKELASATNS